jgi:hypothetical protein
MTRMFAVLVMAGLSATARAQAPHVTRGLDLVNSSHATVTAFFAANAGDGRWNADLLGGRGLRPNFFAQLDLDAPAGVCRYDFKTVFADGSSVVRRGVDVCASQKYTLTDQ